MGKGECYKEQEDICSERYKDCIVYVAIQCRAQHHT